MYNNLIESNSIESNALDIEKINKIQDFSPVYTIVIVNIE